MAADTLGRPIRFILTAGQSGDALAAPALLEGFRPQAVLADKAYDSNAWMSGDGPGRARVVCEVSGLENAPPCPA